MLSNSVQVAREIAVAKPEEALRNEEPVNAVTHGAGGVLAAGGVLVMAFACAETQLVNSVASMTFVVLLTLTYAASAISHAVSEPDRKRRMRAWDQGVIYLLIVGTYTPFLCKYVPTPMLVTVLGLLWAAALTGCISKVVFFHRVGEDFSPWTYVALGWIPALMLCYYVPWECLQWIALGGVVYSIGVVFLTFDKQVPYFHTVWHLSVIAASGLHFYAVYQYVLA